MMVIDVPNEILIADMFSGKGQSKGIFLISVGLNSQIILSVPFSWIMPDLSTNLLEGKGLGDFIAFYNLDMPIPISYENYPC